MSKVHGNAHKSQVEHHLYEIRDTEKEEVLKYGISGQMLNADGSSSRANSQVRLFNRVVGWMRFAANVLIKGISGRAEAEKIEREYIQKHIEETGKRPRGNPERKGEATK